MTCLKDTIRRVEFAIDAAHKDPEFLDYPLLNHTRALLAMVRGVDEALERAGCPDTEGSLVERVQMVATERDMARGVSEEHARCVQQTRALPPPRSVVEPITPWEELPPEDRAAFHLAGVLDSLLLTSMTVDDLAAISPDEAPRAAVERDVLRLREARALDLSRSGLCVLTKDAASKARSLGTLPYARSLLAQPCS